MSILPVSTKSTATMWVLYWEYDKSNVNKRWRQNKGNGNHLLGSNGKGQTQHQSTLPGRYNIKQINLFIPTSQLIQSYLSYDVSPRKNILDQSTQRAKLYKLQSNIKPNTHRRRRRDETVKSRRVGVGGVYMTSRRLPTDSAMRTHNAAVWVTTADGCVHTDDMTKLSPTSCKFVYTPPTRRDSTVSSRRRCVLGLNAQTKLWT